MNQTKEKEIRPQEIVFSVLFPENQQFNNRDLSPEAKHCLCNVLAHLTGLEKIGYLSTTLMIDDYGKNRGKRRMETDVVTNYTPSTFEGVIIMRGEKASD